MSGHVDGIFMRWDVESGEPVGILIRAHESGLTCAAISKDGSTIVTGANDKTLHL